ncbi:hypothetical protein AXK11_08160 [Cephaloticoccus primus]|uniref:PEP-CTERM protein-sorting domain-containing protein n=1 Tax=Cephaloticoccus primus TaxID=1548207 RepID=A0A139SJE3_9BACT|nr:hypothetical protein AXK11_08160 [Cephaloticoccus primus]
MEVTGNGVIDYYHSLDRQHPHGDHRLYLDDLEIEWGGQLTIKNWMLSRDFLLVRKDSEHLNDALSRIKFEGHWEWRAALKDFDKDYWQLIPGIPEPSTYGAALGVVAVGACLMRRRQKAAPVHRPLWGRASADSILHRRR